LGSCFGDYELIEEIGRGGMGIVYKARQRSLNRTVAVKLILSGQFATPQIVQRFRGEAAAAALLRHPNIVAIHEIGLQADHHYFSMDYVEGQNLAQLVRNQPLPAPAAARYVKGIAEAIDYAHRQGILHRDLKPSNVLIDSATDEPRVTDFGLAKRLDGESSPTVTGQVLGSPNFMPPEQASPGHGKVGRPSDVYGLGAILYHALTARAPFQSESLPALLTQVLNADPVPPRLINPSVPPDLETICLKCLEKEPARRYGTAKDLAQDLGRFLADEPILARPIGLVGRTWRWCRRKPVVASLAVALLVASSLGLAGVLWQWRRAVQEGLTARQRLYVSDMNRVQQAWEEGNVTHARDLLLRHTPKAGQTDLRGFEWRYLWKLCSQDNSIFAYTNFVDTAGQLAYSPDGKVLAVAAGHTIKLLDIPSRRELIDLQEPDGNDFIYRVAWSPTDSNMLFTAGNRGVIKRWNLATKEVSVFADFAPKGKPTPYSSMVLSRDGKLLAIAMEATAGADALRIWNVELGKEIWGKSPPHPAGVATFTPDGLAVVSGGSESGNAMVWDAATGKEIRNLPADHTANIDPIVFSPDGRTLATGGPDNRIVLSDFAEPQRKLILASPQVDVVAFCPDGHLVASGGGDGLLRVWEVTTGNLVALLRGHTGPIVGLTFTPNGKELISSSYDRTVRIWDPKAPPDKDVLFQRAVRIDWLAFSLDGKRVASASDRIAVWDVSARRCITNLPGHEPDAGSVAYSPDGQLLAAGSSDGTIRLCHADSLALIDVLTNNLYATPIAFSPDGKVLAVASFTMSRPDGSRRLAIWDIPSRKRLDRLTEAAPDAQFVSFSKDNRSLAVGYLDGWVRLWDFRNGEKLGEFKMTSGQVHSVAFSPDGSVVAAGAGEMIYLHNVAARRKLGLWQAHAGLIWRVMWAPDGLTLASSGNDGVVKLWNLATQELVLALKQDLGPVYSLAFTKDGNLLASGGSNGEIRLWPAAPWEEVRLIK
jgi:WD40 repeat protein